MMPPNVIVTSRTESSGDVTERAPAGAASEVI
jgi:hypothetical protein